VLSECASDASTNRLSAYDHSNDSLADSLAVADLPYCALAEIGIPTYSQLNAKLAKWRVQQEKFAAKCGALLCNGSR
jgi:hypothetical protein